MLGEEDRYTNQVFKILGRIAAHCNEAADRSGLQVDVPIHVKPITLNADDNNACAAFFNRKWFQRNWVIQEIMLSKKACAILGGKCFSFVILERARTLQDFISNISPGILEREDIDGVDITDYLMQAYVTVVFLTYLESARYSLLSTGQADFVSVMQMSRLSQCTDPRDKIYSLLAVCNDLKGNSSISMVPDYLEDVGKVYARATEIVIRNRSDLHVLALITDFERPEDLPSWCPDYRRIRHSNSAETDPLECWKLDGLASLPIQVQDSRLQVFGQCLACVEEKASFSPGSDSWMSQGVAQICSLLTRLRTDEEFETRREK